MRVFHFLKTAALSAVLISASLLAHAQTPNEYQALKPPQPGGTNGQIEVIEFFSYACPHCSEFDPLLTKWRASLDKNVVFKRVPVSFGRPDWDTMGRVYLTLNAMGLSDKLDSLVFKALHTDHLHLDDEKTRNEWLTKQGVDVRQFDNTWHSFSVDSQAKRSLQQIEAYKVMAVPTLAINGKYIVEGGGASGLVTASKLIAKERDSLPATHAPEEAAASAKPSKPSGKKTSK